MPINISDWAISHILFADGAMRLCGNMMHKAAKLRQLSVAKVPAFLPNCILHAQFMILLNGEMLVFYF